MFNLPKTQTIFKDLPTTGTQITKENLLVGAISLAALVGWPECVLGSHKAVFECGLKLKLGLV